jgi:hypothetical protein
MSKQTAVEWFENEINALIRKYENQEISKRDYSIMRHNLFYPAKAMEKEQIEDAFSESRLTHPMIGFKHESFNDYFNETYGGDK